MRGLAQRITEKHEQKSNNRRVKAHRDLIDGGFAVSSQEVIETVNLRTIQLRGDSGNPLRSHSGNQRPRCQKSAIAGRLSIGSGAYYLGMSKITSNRIPDTRFEPVVRPL